MKKARNIEATLELHRLQQNVHRLRGILTPQAIIAVWLLLGDEMWVKNEKPQENPNGD